MIKSFGLSIILFFLFIIFLLLPTPFVFAQSFNAASTYKIDDSQIQSGDIVIVGPETEISRTNISYDYRIFGVAQDIPILVLRPATPSGELEKPIVRIGDVNINVTNFNGEIRKGDYVTTSPVSGKGMKAVSSGYVIGIALEDAQFTDQTSTVDQRQVRNGSVKLAIKIEYAELSGPKNTWRFLNALNNTFFRNIQDPEKFTLTIRYIIAGLIALIAFSIGFFSVSKSIANAIEAIGRNPLARNSILASVSLQILIVIIGAIVTTFIIFIIVRL